MSNDPTTDADNLSKHHTHVTWDRLCKFCSFVSVNVAYKSPWL